MSDSRVETRVDTPVGELSFEEYFVQRWYQDPVNSVRFAGASDAEPAPGVIEAIVSADAVLIAPSNPVTSIGPILAVPGIREALLRARGKIAADQPHRGQRSSGRACRNSDGRRRDSLARLPALHKPMKIFSTSWSAIRAMPAPPKCSARTACACNARKPSCAAPKTKPPSRAKYSRQTDPAG